MQFNIDLQKLRASIYEESLHRFVQAAWSHVDPASFDDGRHIGFLCEYLQAFVAGEIPVLLLNVPPGHCKSLLVSVFLNAWDWTTRPGDRFMYTSYRGDLALRDADRCRQLIRSSWYQGLWGERYQLRSGQDTKGRYENSEKGYRYSTATAGIMGEGGRFIVLDDPHNVDTAESDDVRDDTVRRINLALPTRLREKDGGVCVIMQRLHERDYSGSLIRERDDLVHVCLPAWYETDHPFTTKPIVVPDRIIGDDPKNNPDHIIKGGRELPGDWRHKDGQLLWPSRFNNETLNQMVAQMKAYGKAGQLQQRPSPREGGMFQYDDFQYIEFKELPKNRIIVRGWDLAASIENNADYTAGVRMSYSDGNIYIEHVLRFRALPGGVRKKMRKAAEADGVRTTIDYPQDPGQAGKDQAKDLGRNLHGFNFRYGTESGSKVQRAEGLASQVEAGNVYVVRAKWTENYVDELCGFPAGQYDDQVDASSRAYHRLIRAGGGITSGPLPGAT